MGMYTELIFGASLKDLDTTAIKGIKWLLGDMNFPLNELPNDELFQDTECDNSGIFTVSSYYFGVNEPINRFWHNDIGNDYRLSLRFNLKNYDGEIEKFLRWIRPYISGGSGLRDFYAIVCYEEQDIPTIYYKDEK